MRLLLGLAFMGAKVAIGAIVGLIGLDELLFVAALALVAFGAHLVWPPAGFLVPGLILLWIALPSRAPFVSRTPSDEPAERRAR